MVWLCVTGVSLKKRRHTLMDPKCQNMKLNLTCNDVNPLLSTEVTLWLKNLATIDVWSFVYAVALLCVSCFVATYCSLAQLSYLKMARVGFCDWYHCETNCEDTSCSWKTTILYWFLRHGDTMQCLDIMHLWMCKSAQRLCYSFIFRREIHLKQHLDHHASFSTWLSIHKKTKNSIISTQKPHTSTKAAQSLKSVTNITENV